MKESHFKKDTRGDIMVFFFAKNNLIFVANNSYFVMTALIMFFSGLIRFLLGPNFNGQPHVSQCVTNTHTQDKQCLETEKVFFLSQCVDACPILIMSQYATSQKHMQPCRHVSGVDTERVCRHLSLPPHLSLCSTALPHGKAPF